MSKSTKYTTPVSLNRIVDDAHAFKPLPAPSGNYPYNLVLGKLLTDEQLEKVTDSMTFHLVGDTGSARHSPFQSVLAASINRHRTESEESPAFLYHLGDVVYNHGEASEYHHQFLSHYEAYEAPIFAIPGNHDGDINPMAEPYESLDAFTHVFCSKERMPIRFGQNSKRLTGTQPHVYWTLETPLARIIGLYGNINKHGMIDATQKAWFKEELKRAKAHPEKQALLICLHHAPYSADSNHGSSTPMIELLDEAFEEIDILPDAVFSGHVHNYQRFVKHYPNKDVPYIVAGAGGYADLHQVATKTDSTVSPLTAKYGKVTLENYCDNRFGFLALNIQRSLENNDLKISGSYFALTGAHDSNEEPECVDRFSFIVNNDMAETQLERHATQE
ncbi:metallophosphoesterase family protein [Sphingobacterium corticibacter]|uniref:Metallophosphoesterase n=1 Tax=Sphingobacterium corticibacter TaxID=2171749 RepID=A0A2T8HM47_9SPHI|nr:metallophosphoesterase [Sphingobacterium corticibacter]PVH26519.1 metallophosphoesterase [Sphingobacterium corticibacter]